MELIDKAAVVAEIERRKHKLLDHIICERDKEWVVRTVHQLNRIIMFINTLEVKDVDLDEEIDKWYDTAPDEFEKIHFEHIENCAKHFFELGLKAKEGKE